MRVALLLARRLWSERLNYFVVISQMRPADSVFYFPRVGARFASIGTQTTTCQNPTSVLTMENGEAEIYSFSIYHTFSHVDTPNSLSLVVISLPTRLTRSVQRPRPPEVFQPRGAERAPHVSKSRQALSDRRQSAAESSSVAEQMTCAKKGNAEIVASP